MPALTACFARPSRERDKEREGERKSDKEGERDKEREGERKSDKEGEREKEGGREKE